MTTGSHIEAWKDAISAAILGNPPTLTYDEPVPAGVDEFTRITVTRAARERPWACGIRGALGWRLTTECVSTLRGNAQDMRDDLMRLQDRPLPQIDSTLLEPDGEWDDPEKDADGYWTASAAWLYFAPNPYH